MDGWVIASHVESPGTNDFLDLALQGNRPVHACEDDRVSK